MSSRDKRRDEFIILPDEELMDIYRSTKGTLRLIAVPLLAMMYLTALSLSGLVSGLSHPSDEGTGLPEILTFVSTLTAFIGMTFVFSEHRSLHIKLTAIAAAVEAVPIIPEVIILKDTNYLVSTQIGYFAGILLMNLLAHPFISDLEALKAHPRFPFDNWRKDDGYLFKASTEDKLRYIDSTLNKGKVTTVGSEEYLEGKKTAYAPAEPDPEKNLQQRRQTWRGHEKEETRYVLDNIKNMYFEDGLENGELTGAELEKELIKATAPEKPPEPIPEDFFQQTPIIWRSKKHDLPDSSSGAAPSSSDPPF